MNVFESSMLIVVCALLVGASGSAEAKPAFTPVPEGVVELVGYSQNGGIVELKDGSLMMGSGGSWSQPGDNYRISQDGGRTWGGSQPLNAQIPANGLIRLQSGALAIYGKGEGWPPRWYFSSSLDEGKTWAPPVLIPTYSDFYAMYHSMIQLDSGRLLLAGYWDALNPTAPDAWRYTRGGWGIWRGLKLGMDGHRGPGFGKGLVYYSDDEGQSWQQCEGGLFGWFDERGIPNGEGGSTNLCEPTAAQTKDGRVLLFGRSRTGRLVQSYSPDEGQTWYSVLPTELSSSQSPPLLIRIPMNGDLLCVWNQVSEEEINRGFARGRLSAAISTDSGRTWEHFKTLEVQEGMADVARIIPSFPIPRITRGRPGMCELPDGFAMFTYPNVDIVGDQVFIRYYRMWPEVKADTDTALDSPPRPWEQYEKAPYEAEMTAECVLRIYPLEWFYQ